MTQPDVLLFRANNKSTLYPGLEEASLTACEPPLWGAILAGELRTRGHDVTLWDAEVERWTYQETIDRINDLSPRIAVMLLSGTNPSASSMQMVGIDGIFPFLEGRIATAVHGLHPSALPDETADRHPSIGIVIQGEGIEAIDMFLKGSRSPGPHPLENLHSLAPPAWDLLPIEKYRSTPFMAFDYGMERQPYAVTYTSLGCPFGCSFCCINSLFGRRGIRLRPIDDVVEELILLKEAHPTLRHVKITDEMFALDERRVVALCDRIADASLGLNFEAYARVDTVTPRMLDSMKAAGINWIAYGFEAGDDATLAGSAKGQTIDQIYRAVAMTTVAGIEIVGNYVFGLPGSSVKSDLATYHLALDLLTPWANMNTAMAYPGSRLYDETSYHPSSYTAYAQHTPNSEPIGGPNTVRFRDWAWTSYHFYPIYLQFLEGRFGEEACDFVRQMASTPLRRNFHVQG